MSFKMKKKMVELTADDIQALVKEAEAWIRKSGSRDIQKALAKANSTASQLSSDRLVDLDTLRVPLNL